MDGLGTLLPCNSSCVLWPVYSFLVCLLFGFFLLVFYILFSFAFALHFCLLFTCMIWTFAHICVFVYHTHTHYTYHLTTTHTLPFFYFAAAILPSLSPCFVPLPYPCFALYPAITLGSFAVGCAPHFLFYTYILQDLRARWQRPYYCLVCRSLYVAPTYNLVSLADYSCIPTRPALPTCHYLPFCYTHTHIHTFDFTGSFVPVLDTITHYPSPPFSLSPLPWQAGGGVCVAEKGIWFLPHNTIIPHSWFIWTDPCMCMWDSSVQILVILCICVYCIGNICCLCDSDLQFEFEGVGGRHLVVGDWTRHFWHQCHVFMHPLLFVVPDLVEGRGNCVPVFVPFIWKCEWLVLLFVVVCLPPPTLPRLPPPYLSTCPSVLQSLLCIPAMLGWDELVGGPFCLLHTPFSCAFLFCLRRAETTFHFCARTACMPACSTTIGILSCIPVLPFICILPSFLFCVAACIPPPTCLLYTFSSLLSFYTYISMPSFLLPYKIFSPTSIYVLPSSPAFSVPLPSLLFSPKPVHFICVHSLSISLPPPLYSPNYIFYITHAFLTPHIPSPSASLPLPL